MPFGYRGMEVRVVDNPNTPTPSPPYTPTPLHPYTLTPLHPSKTRSNTVIELVSASRCIKCNICVNICPTNVFDRVPDAPPAIARKSDCQTCYMCELYCPVDALYVAPESDLQTSVNEAELAEEDYSEVIEKILAGGQNGLPQPKMTKHFKFSNK